MKLLLCLLVLIFDVWSQETECGYLISHWTLPSDKCGSLLTNSAGGTPTPATILSVIRSGDITELGVTEHPLWYLSPGICAQNENGQTQRSWLHPQVWMNSGSEFPAGEAPTQGAHCEVTSATCQGYLISTILGHPTVPLFFRGYSQGSVDTYLLIDDEPVDFESGTVVDVDAGAQVSFTLFTVTPAHSSDAWFIFAEVSSSHDFCCVAEGHCHGIGNELESESLSHEVHFKAPVAYVPLSIYEGNFDITVAVPSWPQNSDIQAQLHGTCKAYEDLDDIQSLVGVTVANNQYDFVVGNPCSTPIVETFLSLSSVGKPPYANVHRVCFDSTTGQCVFGSTDDDCGVLIHPVSTPLCHMLEIPDVDTFVGVCCAQIHPCNTPRMSFLTRPSSHTPETVISEPFSFLRLPNVAGEVSFSEVLDEEVNPIVANTLVLSPEDEVTIRISWETVCPVVVVDLAFQINQQSELVHYSHRWFIGPHWGYDFALYEVGDVSSVELESLNPSFVGAGMMAINHYGPKDVLYFNFGNQYPIWSNPGASPVLETPEGYESYVIVFKTSIMRSSPEICNLEVAYTGSVKFRVNGVLKDWVHSTTGSTVSFNDHEFQNNVFTVVEIVYWKHLNLETNIALQWSCDTPHYVVPLGYLHSYPPDTSSLLRVSRSTVNLNNHNNNLFFDCLVEPSADVSLNCVSHDSAILFDKCQLLFSSSNWVASQQIKIWPSGNEQITSSIICSVESEDSRYNGLELVIEVQKTPVEPFLCQVGFDFSVCCSGVSAGEFQIDSHRPDRAVDSSLTLYLFKTRADADITFHLQVQGQLCQGNKLCIIGAIFQYGDEIFGVYRPTGMKACRPMCINSVGNTKIKIVVEEGRYVLSTMLGLRIEFNVVYGSNGHEFLDVKAYVPAFLKDSFETSWCMPPSGSVPRHNISLWNAGNQKLDRFPQIMLKARFDPPGLCGNGEFNSGLTDVVLATEKIPCTPLVDDPINIQEEPVQFPACSVPNYIRNSCPSFMQSQEVLDVIQNCEDNPLLSICPRTYRQSFLSAVSVALRSACDREQTRALARMICETSLNSNPNLCGGRGTVSRSGCQCDEGFFTPACSGFTTITPLPCQHSECDACEDRSTLLDSRTGEVWKCFKGYCMYSRNGIVWEGLPSIYGSSAFCLISISWDDTEKRTGRTLWGYTATMIPVRSIDEGKTWQPAVFNATAKEVFGNSLRLNTTNKSPWKKGNSHDVPEDAEQGRQGYFWWMTFEELCVQSSHYTTIEKPMIFCSKWWCDCLDVDEWGTTFGVQQIA
jgi:hypothetical protein